MLNILQCTKVFHNAKNCLTPSANNTLIEKHRDHKFSGQGLCLFCSLLCSQHVAECAVHDGMQ